MRTRPVLDPSRALLLGAALVSVLVLAGCEEGASVIDGAAPDAGDRASDASHPDAGPVACEGDVDCEDGRLCTIDRCEEGICSRTTTADCDDACETDADCDDGDPSTHEYCQPFFQQCVVTECVTDADCDDASPCTLDYCLSMNSCGHADNHLCCDADSDCADAYECTIDTCESGMCQFTPTPSCGGCPDRDGDGWGPDFCGGTDCDDFDPARSADHAEVCDNAIDDDCDRAIDVADLSCRPPYFTCGGAVAITAGTATHGVALTDGSMPVGTGCGGSAFFTFVVPELSDVEITLELDRPTTTPPPGSRMELDYRAYLETSCGDPATDVLGTAGGCNYWDPSGSGFFSGVQSTTYSRRRVAAGTYTIEVQAGPMFSWMTSTTGFTVTARATPSASATCDGPVLGATAVRGTTEGGADAFGLACDGSVSASVERIHPFALAARSRVRLTATPDVPSGGSSPSVRLGILSSCDAGSATRLACIESRGYECQPSAVIERVLDPGTYEALVERSSAGPVDYALALEVEAVGAACEGASVISSSGMYSGTTVGAADRFRDSGVCGGGAGPDVVHRLEVVTRARVVLDLVASYERSQVRLYRGCGEERIAGTDSPRIDTTLEPGTYDIVVGGQGAGDAGSYVLSVTMLAAP